ncbi:hypothetical protein ABEB36_011029 [Hypothenemus hampei]|uniref:Nuclear pore complex protein Nup133 n=1 Tax=Hypothenemus hampei TaxID=57062 RepID=A0ABD1EDX8_HYPHA
MSALKTGFTPSKSNTSSRMSLNHSFKDVSQRRKPSSVNIILKRAHITVERFGLSVPVLIEEAFSFSERNSVITGKVCPNGYAWVVCGRKLFIWQYQNMQVGSPSKQPKHPTCYELKLPQSDLAHRSELVNIFSNKLSVHPSCVVVSPEGMVRYWPDITHHNNSVDKRVELNGEECDSLVHVGTIGCVFVTTTCTVVLIQYKEGAYGHELFCRPLKTPGTWLGGISKRVSSIFFGPISSDEGNETKIIRLLAIHNVQQEYSIYVLAGVNLQKWILQDYSTEQLSWAADLIRPLKDSFKSHISHWELCHIADIEVWILDMQPDREGQVLMLCAAVNLRLSPQVYYAMAAFAVNSANPPSETKDFLLLKITGVYKDSNLAEVLDYRFTLCGINAYIYNRKSITVIKPEEDPDPLECVGPQDHIFSGCIYMNTPIFFSRQHGLVAITNNQSKSSLFGTKSITFDSSLTENSFNANINNLSIYHVNPNEVYDACHDSESQLKAAFVFHVKNQLSDSYSMVNKLFPSEAPVLPGFDGLLDTIVVAVAKHILDDVPIGDPRWSSDSTHRWGLGSSHSMLVINQLRDKQHAFSLYLKFLKESGLWNKLTGITVRDTGMATIHILAELAEKLTAAIVWKTLPDKMQLLIYDEAIQKTVQNYSTEVGDNLSNYDIFFREITRIHESFSAISALCEEDAHSLIETGKLVGRIHDGNAIMLTVLTEVLQYRQHAKETFMLNDASKKMKLEFLPWTIALGSEGVMDALLLQQSVTLNYGLKVLTEGKEKDALLEEYVMFTDIILDGRKTHLQTVSFNRENMLYKQYCSDRTKLIKPLIDLQAQVHALRLAEKYLDFEVILLVCESNEDDDRINEYMKRFKNNGFPEFVYNWYLKEGKQAKLLKRYRVKESIPEGQDRLQRFLSSYPTLSWMQQIFDGDFASAAETLRLLSENERELITRQKSMISLSKLSKLAAPPASDTLDHLEDVNKRLQLIALQERIPDYVLEKYGCDSIKPRVFEPKELVALYISPEYEDSSEFDFQKALDVTNFTEDDNEKVELVLQVSFLLFIIRPLYKLMFYRFGGLLY